MVDALAQTLELTGTRTLREPLDLGCARQRQLRISVYSSLDSGDPATKSVLAWLGQPHHSVSLSVALKHSHSIQDRESECESEGQD